MTGRSQASRLAALERHHADHRLPPAPCAECGHVARPSTLTPADADAIRARITRRLDRLAAETTGAPPFTGFPRCGTCGFIHLHPARSA